MSAGNAIVDGIAASNFIVQEDRGLVLDAASSERIKYLVRMCFVVTLTEALDLPAADAVVPSRV